MRAYPILPTIRSDSKDRDIDQLNDESHTENKIRIIFGKYRNCFVYCCVLWEPPFIPAARKLFFRIQQRLIIAIMLIIKNWPDKRHPLSEKLYAIYLILSIFFFFPVIFFQNIGAAVTFFCNAYTQWVCNIDFVFCIIMVSRILHKVSWQAYGIRYSWNNLRLYLSCFLSLSHSFINSLLSTPREICSQWHLCV